MGEIKLSCYTGPWGEDGLIHAMQAMQRIGFEGIECPAGVIQRFEDRMPVFEEILENVKLQLSSIYQPLFLLDGDKSDEQVERAANAARFLNAAGQGHLLVVPADEPEEPLGDEDWTTVGAILDEAGDRCRDFNVSLCFVPSARSFGAAERDLKRLMVSTNAECVFLAIDTAECALAGVEAAKLVKTYHDRLKIVRLREASGAKRKPGAPFHPPPAFGRGVVKFDAVAKALLDTRYGGWTVIDVSNESGDPATAAEVAYRHIFRRSGLFAY